MANPDQYFRYTASFICHNFAYNCNSCIAFHLSIKDIVISKNANVSQERALFPEHNGGNPIFF